MLSDRGREVTVTQNVTRSNEFMLTIGNKSLFELPGREVTVNTLQLIYANH